MKKHQLFLHSDCYIDLSAETLVRNGTISSLSPTEFHLIQRMADHAGHIVTYDELISSVSELVDGFTLRNLYWHIRRLRIKLEKTPEEPKCIISARRLGYILVASRESAVAATPRW